MPESQIVVVSDPIHSSGLDLLAQRFDVRVHRSTDGEPLWTSLAVANAVIVRAMQFDSQAVDRCPALQVIAKHGAGLDNIDVEAATRRGIMVCATFGANAAAVAEHSVALMLATLRRVPETDRLVREGRFSERWGLLFGDLWHRKVGIVGFGNIGRIVAQICRDGFGAEILVHDPALSSEAISQLGARKVEDLGELCDQVDILSVNAPLTDATRGMIGAAELAGLGPDGIVVSTARGGVIDEAALVDALAKGAIYGAGIDVFEEEPPRTDNPLLSQRNVVLSPHIGGATEASRRRASEESAQAVITALSGGTPKHLVNGAMLARAQS